MEFFEKCSFCDATILLRCFWFGYAHKINFEFALFFARFQSPQTLLGQRPLHFLSSLTTHIGRFFRFLHVCMRLFPWATVLINFMYVCVCIIYCAWAFSFTTPLTFHPGCIHLVADRSFIRPLALMSIYGETSCSVSMHLQPVWICDTLTTGQYLSCVSATNCRGI